MHCPSFDFMVQIYEFFNHSPNLLNASVSFTLCALFTVTLFGKYGLKN